MKQRNQSHPCQISAEPSSATDRTRHDRRSLIFILVVALCLSGCMTRAAALATEQFTFKPYEIVTGLAKRQTVLTGFLLGSAVAELAVLNIDGNGNRRLRIYAFSGNTWEPRLDTTLRPGVLFVDVANIGGRDRLITYERGRLNWFDPESAMERALVAVHSNFNPPRRDEIPHVDVTQDVNNDNRDDLVVPDVDGFWVCIQISHGAFADPVKLGPSTEMGRILGADGYRYNPWGQSRIHEMDYNRDGHSDLVFWNEDHFEVHLQNERGLFTSVAKTFTTDVAFDSDDLSSLATGDIIGRVLHSLTDLSGDGVADLVVFSLEGTSIASKRSTYEVHFGAPTPDGGTAFARGVDIAFESDGNIQLGMDRHDLDRDGQVDLMFTTIEVRYLESSLWKRIKGFMGDDIWLTIEFYRMAGGLYPDNPNATRRRQLDGHPSIREPGWVPLDIVLRGGTHESRRRQKRYPRAFNTTLLIGDVTGDGRSDLIIEETHKQLRVFAGVPGPNLFAQQPQTVAVAVPNDEEYTWLVDLNQDDKQDILMHHPSTTEPHRVTLLMTR